MIDNAIAFNILRLWHIDYSSGDRTELFQVPSDIGYNYSESGLDGRYDPISLSLTLGPSADDSIEPEWTFNLDFDTHAFEVMAHDGFEQEAIDQLHRYYPDLRAVVVHRVVEGRNCHLAGRLELRPEDNRSRPISQ